MLRKRETSNLLIGAKANYLFQISRKSSIWNFEAACLHSVCNDFNELIRMNV